MADVNLDDLLAKRSEGKAGDEAGAPKADRTAAIEQQRETQLALDEVTDALAQMTPEEKRQVAEIRDNIDVTDSTGIVSFGAPAQQKLAQFSENVLREVRSKDSGEVGQLLQTLMSDVRTYEDSQKERENGFLHKLPLIGKLMNKAQSVKDGYDKLSTQVDEVEAGLEQARLKMMKDIALFDHLFAENLSYFKNLQLYIAAGEQKLHELQTETLPRLRTQAAQSDNPMAAQVVADYEQSVNRFEKKVHDLKISKTIAIQTAPQIRLLQNNDKELIDRVQTAIYNTIPLWKNQLVIALGLASQREVLRLNQAVSRTTNELLRRNAEMLRQNTAETAQENERSIVDIETVAKVNEELIATLEDTVKIQDEGRAKRQAAEQELANIEDRLRGALLERVQRERGQAGQEQDK